MGAGKITYLVRYLLYHVRSTVWNHRLIILEEDFMVSVSHLSPQLIPPPPFSLSSQFSFLASFSLKNFSQSDKEKV